MTKFYTDYFWKGGLPQGRTLTEESAADYYKIVMDPYRSWVTIEKYQKGNFQKIVYDSQKLNFRKLKPETQTAWMKTPQDDSFLIRDQNDRIIYIETYTFQGHLCRTCLTLSPEKTPLARTEMYYKHLGDPFNGIILYDRENHPVMYKTYEVDPESFEFTTLIHESWDMTNGLSPI